MDIQALNKAIQEILKHRAALTKLDYSSAKYDELEENLHNLEDALQAEYGEYLEEAFQEVHDQLCPDNDVLMPIAYLDKGIYVETDKYPAKETMLILEPNPPRIVLHVGKEKQEVCWTATEEEA